MTVRGVRGATTVAANDAVSILAATTALLQEIVSINGIEPADIGCAYFTVTGDLTAAFPARAARDLGWHHVPLMDALEIPVPGSLPHCIRVMLLWNTDLPQKDVQHVYLNQAVGLRPDLVTDTREPQKESAR